MNRQGMIGLLAIGLMCSAGLARDGVVKTREGRTYEGDVQEKPDRVVVVIHGVETTIPRETIASLEYLPPFETQLAQRLGKLGPRDVAGRIEVARWAFDHRQYDAARQVLDDALKIDPNSKEATDMWEIVRIQMRLEHSSRQPATPAPSANKPGQPAAIPAVAEPRLLNAEQINVIRQGELRSTDKGVNILFQNDVKKRYLLASRKNARDFNALRPVDQALEIIDYNDRKLIEDIKVNDDPASVREFRTKHQRFILASCAGVGCHVGNTGGKLVLFNMPESEAATYTNYYILQKYSQPTGNSGSIFSGATEVRGIDRKNPEGSLVLQFGLPLPIAQYKHPEVQGWKIVYPGTNNPRYMEMLAWIRDISSINPPEYKLNYEIPVATPAPPPASQPAAATTRPAKK